MTTHRINYAELERIDDLIIDRLTFLDRRGADITSLVNDYMRLDALDLKAYREFWDRVRRVPTE